MNIFLGFDFYGAGNIGDDLMLAGFVQEVIRKVALPCNIYCCLDKSRIASQNLRFPEIHWLPNSTEERQKLLTSVDLWLGVGGTPFQGSSGGWLLEQIAADLDQLSPTTPALMLGIGCEHEIASYSNLAKKVGDRCNLILARDEASASILTNNIGLAKARVKASSDLAHIALKELFGDLEDHKSDVIAILFYQESASVETLNSLRVFADARGGHSQLVFFANETRWRGFERSLFDDIYGRRHRLRFWLNAGRPSFISPCYKTSTLQQLFPHYESFKTVLASRYHALLAAAWAGCHLAALGRSSKITHLAAELEIPIVSEPYVLSRLHLACDTAPKVNRDKLESMRNNAISACMQIVEIIEKIGCGESIS